MAAEGLGWWHGARHRQVRRAGARIVQAPEGVEIILQQPSRLGSDAARAEDKILVADGPSGVSRIFRVRSIPETSEWRNLQAPAQIGAMGELTVLGCKRPTATSWIKGTKVYFSLRSISRASPGLRRAGGRCLSREAPANPAPRTTTRALRRTLTLRAIHESFVLACPCLLRYTRHLPGVYRSECPLSARLFTKRAPERRLHGSPADGVPAV